jgi:uncharacterized membrane protein
LLLSNHVATQSARGRRLGSVDAVNWIAGLLIVIGGIAVGFTASLAKSGSLGRNHYAGIRTRTTLSSDRAWQAAHTVSYVPMLVGAMVFIGAGFAAMANAWPVVLVLMGTGLVVVVAGGVAGQRAAKASVKA